METYMKVSEASSRRFHTTVANCKGNNRYTGHPYLKLRSQPPKKRSFAKMMEHSNNSCSQNSPVAVRTLKVQKNSKSNERFMLMMKATANHAPHEMRIIPR